MFSSMIPTRSPKVRWGGEISVAMAMITSFSVVRERDGGGYPQKQPAFKGDELPAIYPLMRSHRPLYRLDPKRALRGSVT